LQYKNAIKSAKEMIYIENQHICDEEILYLLIEALKRYFHLNNRERNIFVFGYQLLLKSIIK
jgi:hypothetical protein